MAEGGPPKKMLKPSGAPLVIATAPGYGPPGAMAIVPYSSDPRCTSCHGPVTDAHANPDDPPCSCHGPEAEAHAFHYGDGGAMGGAPIAHHLGGAVGGAPIAHPLGGAIGHDASGIEELSSIEELRAGPHGRGGAAAAAGHGLRPPKPDGDAGSDIRIGSMIDRYKIEKLLGEGSFGKVVAASDVYSDEEVAIKMIKTRGSSLRHSEMEILGMIARKKVKNFVNTITQFRAHGMDCIVFEKLDLSLYDYLKDVPMPMHLTHIQFIAKQVLEALDGLKSLRIAHADLKTQNIMFVDSHDFENPYEVKIIDLGLARVLQKHNVAPRPIGTIYTRAPEIILGSPYNEAIDMWSLACVLLELYRNRIMFYAGNHYDLLDLAQTTLNSGVPSEMLKQALHTSKYFNLVRKSVYAFKTRRQYALQNPGERGIQSEPTRAKTGHLRMFGDLLTENMESPLLQKRDFLDFIVKTLTWKPEDRLTPSKALKHKFIAEKTDKKGLMKLFATLKGKVKKRPPGGAVMFAG